MSMQSVHIAKARLKNLLVADRIQCTPEAAERLSKDIFYTVAKHIEVEPEHIRVKISRSDIHIQFAGEKF